MQKVGMIKLIEDYLVYTTKAQSISFFLLTEKRGRKAVVNEVVQ